MTYIIPQSNGATSVALLAKRLIRNLFRLSKPACSTPPKAEAPCWRLQEDLGITTEQMKSLTGGGDPQRAARAQMQQARRFDALR